MVDNGIMTVKRCGSNQETPDLQNNEKKRKNTVKETIQKSTLVGNFNRFVRHGQLSNCADVGTVRTRYLWLMQMGIEICSCVAISKLRVIVTLQVCLWRSRETG